MKKRAPNLRKDFAFNGVVLKNFVNIDDREKKAVRVWRNSECVRKWMYSSHAITPREHERFIGGLCKDQRNFYWLARLEDGEYLGVVSLNRVDAANGNAYLGMYANPSCKAGTGRVLMECLKRLAFEVAGLHTLKLEVIESNERAIGFYKKSGFRTEGRLREFVLKDGRRMDVVVMGITENAGNGGRHGF